MFETSVPVLIHHMKALTAILEKAEAHCEAKKIDPSALLNFRLFPDMYPLIRQVTLVSDFAKGAGARLAGIAVPSYADEEKSFADLKARLAKTIDFLGTLKPDQLADAATRQVVLKVGDGEMTFSGASYFSYFALPNFYFHAATAYGILRHNGVELGKRDFMGRA
ncbi:DUF1993 domain-containing protein [Aestuariivirga sp.]|uniref:DUF1993 domain-containing protein n=1 Tax=Aestuariivirga sp. TaxID=2650926 RepID=UPI0039E25F65